ncbi:hypothetical protein BVC71_14200 [Marivivens niveibacter]|uniref:histidine kinase n=1 Tax=Marivivens niveibacter TaxID=1930667 RepID=A0A251WV07_9RHOB|nr:HWE histidine kinase domain-containing protein [Marivivens niveibacter]OUD08319.1 hypothetical protein BVC71_14200 [Marivivens niveibacter]
MTINNVNVSDADRLAALHGTGLLDSPSEEVFDRPVRIASHIFGTPIALLSFVDERRQFFKSQLGLPADVAQARETPLSHSFCQHVVENKEPLVVTDAREVDELRDNKAISDLDVISYLGVPVKEPGGEILGSFCVIENQPRKWTDAELEILEDLAKGIETELELRAQLQRAAAAEAQTKLLTQELNHRVKNLFTVVSGIASMTLRTAETVKDARKTLVERIQALANAHALIQPALSGNPSQDKGATLDVLVTNIIKPYLNDGLNIRIQGPSFGLTGTATTAMALVIHELATNAAKYGALSVDAGSLNIEWSLTDDELMLIWHEQNGPTIAQAPTSSGFGSTLITSTIHQDLGGTCDKLWDADGLKCTVTVPRDRLAQQG